MTIDEYRIKIMNRPSIVAYHPLAPNLGAKADDLSRFQNHSPITGAVYQGNRGAGSLLFDGVDDFVDLGQPVQLQDLNNLTISCWLKMTVAPGAARIVTKWEGGGSEGFFFRLHPTLGLQFRTNFDTTDGVFVTSENPDWTARFYHLSVSVSNRKDADTINVNLFVDGDQIPTVINTSPVGDYVSEAVNCFIGKQAPSAAFLAGILSDLQIDNTALRSDEVRQVYEDSLSFYGPR